jgi:hypothetical protein
MTLIGNIYEILTTKEDFHNNVEEMLSKDLIVKKVLFNREPVQLALYSVEETNQRDLLKVSVPRYYGIRTFGPPSVYGDPDKMNRVKFQGKLREYQKKPVSSALDLLQEFYGAIITGDCGIGKTAMAIYVACMLQMKTMVVVESTAMINDVWIPDLKKFVPDASVAQLHGKVKKDISLYETCDFLICIINSLSRMNIPRRIRQKFGLIVWDECHHIPAPTFFKKMSVVKAPYQMGVTATPFRRDLTWKLAEECIGPIVTPDTSCQTTYTMAIHVIKMRYGLLNSIRHTYDIQKLIHGLRGSQPRGFIIMSLILLFTKTLIPSTLILTAHVNHMLFMYEYFRRYNKCSSVEFIYGKCGDLSEIISNRPDVIFSVYKYSGESINIEFLNNEFMITPQSLSVEQAIGRVRRQSPHIVKNIFDFVDVESSFAIALYKKRLGVYNKLKKTTNIEMKYYSINV